MENPTFYPMVAGDAIHIRPIRLTDQAMEADFVRQLSPQSKHFRFLGGIKELSPKEVKRFCDVDGRHSMAFIATVTEGGKEREIGVSRYAPNSASDTREMAVAVADDWQQRGLGTKLVKQLIDYARDQGVQQLYSIDLNDNAAMHELADDLGMTSRRDPDDPTQTIYSLAL